MSTSCHHHTWPDFKLRTDEDEETCMGLRRYIYWNYGTPEQRPMTGLEIAFTFGAGTLMLMSLAALVAAVLLF